MICNPWSPTMRKTAPYKFLRNSLLLIPLIYIAALLALYAFQRHFLYFPSSTYISLQAAHAPAAMKELPARTDDGLDLKAWYAPATGEPLTIVFFHGNGDSLRTAAFIAPPYLAAGYGFMLVEYRGYSGMPGSPTEVGIYSDARADIQSLIASGVKADDIVLFGYSLGTGVAVQMAHEFHARGLILLAPYMSVAKQAQMTFPFFPAGLLVKDRYENFRKIPDLHIPILMANGGRDEVIPPSQGSQLFALANEPKQFAFIPEAGHSDLFQSEFVDVSLQWLARLAANTGTK
jgi:fermentation-respiration switch protein FrsA (DUF1100 family)